MKIRMTPGRWIGVAILTLIAILAIWIISSAISANNGGVSKQNALNAQYADNQNNLSNCITTSVDSLNIAGLKTDKLKSILVDAVKGRYDTGAASGAVQGDGKLFSALAEAYPDLSGTDIYDKVLSYAQGCRDDYKNLQSKLLDMLNDFDSWRQSFPKSLFTGGLPNNTLRAAIGADVVYGQKAEDRMRNIVLAKGATDSYTSGTLQQLPMPSTTTP